MNGKPLVYFDNAATSQKPQVVIDAMMRYYEEENSNIHRGVHSLSERATQAYEGVRKKVRAFLNAADAPGDHLRARHDRGNQPRGAQLRPDRRRAGRRGARSPAMEHHSNIVPWQILCDEKRATLRVIPINDAGEIIWRNTSGC